jgi:hypothetical protein
MRELNTLLGRQVADNPTTLQLYLIWWSIWREYLERLPSRENEPIRAEHVYPGTPQFGRYKISHPQLASSTFYLARQVSAMSKVSHQLQGAGELPAKRQKIVQLATGFTGTNSSGGGHILQGNFVGRFCNTRPIHLEKQSVKLQLIAIRFRRFDSAEDLPMVISARCFLEPQRFMQETTVKHRFMVH